MNFSSPQRHIEHPYLSSSPSVNDRRSPFANEPLSKLALQNELDVLKQKLFNSEKNYAALENNLNILMSENGKLNEIIYAQNNRNYQNEKRIESQTIQKLEQDKKNQAQNIEKLTIMNQELKSDNEFMAKALSNQKLKNEGFIKSLELDYSIKKSQLEKEYLNDQEEKIKKMESAHKAEKETLEKFNDELIAKVRNLENELDDFRNKHRENLDKRNDQEAQIKALSIKLSDIEKIMNKQTNANYNHITVMTSFFLMCIENERLHQIIHEFSIRIMDLEAKVNKNNYY